MQREQSAAIEPPVILAPQIRGWQFDSAVTGLVFTRSGRHFAAALGDGTLRIGLREDTQTGLLPVEVHGGAVLSLRPDPDSDAFLSGGDDGRLIRTEPGGSHDVLLHAPGQLLDTIAACGGIRAVGVGRELRLLDPAGREIGRSASHPSTVSGLAFNPKGKRIAVAHYGGVTLWWAGSLGGGPPKRYNWRGSHIGVTWSPDGNYIITATQESELHGWRVNDGADMRMSGYARKVRALDWIARPLHLASSGSDSVIVWPFTGKGPMGKPPVELGFRGGALVTSVAAHPARPLVAVAYDDGEVRIAELSGARTVSVKQAGGGNVTNIAWSPDGAILGTGTEEGLVCLFDLSKSAAPA